MTRHERLFWLRVQRRASELEPDVASAILRAFKNITENLSEPELAQIIRSGALDQIADSVLNDAALDRAFRPVQVEIRKGVEDAVTYHARGLPNAGKIDGQLAVGFDILNPRVITAVRQLDTKVMTTLKGNVRETVRAFVENGLRDGVGPEKIARGIRDVVGLAPNHLAAIENYRAELEAGKRGLQRAMRDRRYDKAALTPERIEKMVTAYERRLVNLNAQTNARTAALDSLKLGQKLSVDDAIEKGIYDPSRLMKRWVNVGDERVRPLHVQANGEEVPYDQPYPTTGEQIPGESTYNCRCISRYFQRAA